MRAGYFLKLIATLFLVSPAPTCIRATNQEGVHLEHTTPRPRYLINLTLNEFSVLNVAEMDGLIKYGGGADFHLKIAKQGNEVVWTITIDNARLMELLGIFVGEKTMKLVQSLDLNSIDPNQKIALEAIKSLTLKMEHAQKNPVWDSLKISGVVLQDGTNWVIQAKDDKFKIVGNKTQSLSSKIGKPVVADGFVKMAGQFEVTRFVEKKQNTLELFVMSLCPFGQRAETALYSFLERTNINPAPNLEIRYIFYRQQKDGQEVFAAMHGESEITENLVQIVIRDQFQQSFKTYLRLRTTNGSLPWPAVASEAGLGQDAIAEIEKTIVSQRYSLIRKEYDYVSGQHEVLDGSPSYVWESERVTDLKSIDEFSGMEDSAHGNCSR